MLRCNIKPDIEFRFIYACKTLEPGCHDGLHPRDQSTWVFLIHPVGDGRIWEWFARWLVYHPAALTGSKPDPRFNPKEPLLTRLIALVDTGMAAGAYTRLLYQLNLSRF